MAAAAPAAAAAVPSPAEFIASQLAYLAAPFDWAVVNTLQQEVRTPPLPKAKTVFNVIARTNVSLQDAARANFGQELQRRLATGFAETVEKHYSAPKSSTVPRPETLAKWRELPETWQDSGDVRPADLRKYQTARRKCEDTQKELDQIRHDLAHLRHVADMVEVVASACQGDGVQVLADQLKDSADTVTKLKAALDSKKRRPQLREAIRSKLESAAPTAAKRVKASDMKES